MRVHILLVLCSSLTWAQGNTGESTTDISRGNGLRVPEYRTAGTGAVTFYVDPLGNDSNTCTAPGADACLTIQGGLNKAPKLLRDMVTVNIAAGTYAGYTVAGFTVDTSVQQNNGGLLIDGALVTSTLASGTATGTATGGSAGSGSTFGTLVHATQTWTINDLRGRLITTVSPTNTALVISSNTADTITVVGTWAAPIGATTTYTILDPSVIITGAVMLPATPTSAAVANRAAIEIQDNVLNYREDVLVLRNQRVANTVGAVAIEISDTSSINLSQLQIRPTLGTAQGIFVNSLTAALVGRVQVQRCDVSLASTNSGLFAQSGTIRSINTLWRNSVAGTHAIFLGSGGGGLVRAAGISNSETLGFVNGVSLVQAIGNTLQNSRITCANGTGIGYVVGSLTTNVSGLPSAASTITSVNITTCGTGLQVVGPASADVTSMTGAAATTGFSVIGGGLVTFSKAGVTMTAGTNELNLDMGGTTALFADVAAGTSIATGPMASRVYGR